MYGHGAVPPARSDSNVVILRVLFAAIGTLCCGMLACVPLFRVAFLRGRKIDWALAWGSLPVSVGCFAVVGALPESDHRTDIAMATVMLLGVFSSVYFLVVDIRFQQQRQFAGYPPQGPNVPSGYGYPQPVTPFSATPVSQPPLHQTQMPQPPQPYTPPQPHTPVPPPPPQRPAPARIDQVRAELDELSDYLRKHDEGGR
ncbi:hypothetical protein AB0I69_35560 [Streptomyces sp. NPDC050508]|jgi:hypothetical protein|uniref:hypothetical protein n=1 Tax=Streptomyces sp. NPDC050508 TaxID=3155405 RepID=UPI003424C84B